MDARRAHALVFRTRPRGDFLIRPFRCVVGSAAVYGTALLHVSREEYTTIITSKLQAALQAFHVPMDASEADRSPEPPIQSFCALVREDTAGGFHMSTMRRLHGGHAGTGDTYTLGASDIAKLPETLLLALGEREEDVPAILAKGRTSTSQGESGPSPRRRTMR